MIPGTKVARQNLIAQILRTQRVRSQADLISELRNHEVVVSQGTLSRDLEELRAVRTRDADGAPGYALPAADPSDRLDAGSLARRGGDLRLDAGGSGNLVVRRTPPAAAHFLASAIDNAQIPAILGTIAGDDTVLLIASSESGSLSSAGDSAELLRYFLTLASKSNAVQQDRKSTRLNSSHVA